MSERAGALDLAVLVAAVGADHQDRLRPAVGTSSRTFLTPGIAWPSVRTMSTSSSTSSSAARGDRRGREQHDEDARQGGLLDDAQARARRLVEVGGHVGETDAAAGSRGGRGGRRTSVRVTGCPAGFAGCAAQADAPPSTARSGGGAGGRRLAGQVRGQPEHEVAERLAVALQRGDRDPLLGAVVAAADRARTRPPGCPPRGTRSRRTRRRGRSISASPSTERLDGVAQRAARRVVARDDRRRARWNERDDLDVRQIARPGAGSRPGPGPGR